MNDSDLQTNKQQTNTTTYTIGRFKDDFKEEIKNIFKRMFRVYAHIYYSHYKDAQKLQVDRHLNTAFKHFVLFVLEFDLVDKKELQPLKSTIFELVGRTV